MLGRKKKVQDCDYVFGSSTKFQRRMNGFVKADICRQVSVCLHVFCGILFALKPFCDYSLCSVCILPQPAFYSQSVVCILHSVCILPLVRSLRFTLTEKNTQETIFCCFYIHHRRMRSKLSCSLQRVMELFLGTGKIHAAFNKICGITIFIPQKHIPNIIAPINFHFSSLLVCKVANQLYFPTPYKIFQLYF